MFPAAWARRAVLRSSAPASPRRRASLRLTPLEDRTVPATFRWVNPAGGDFATAANWQDDGGNPGVPGPADDALILTSGIVVTSAGTTTVRNLTSLAALDVTAGTLTAAAASLSGPVDIAGGTLAVNGPSSAGSVVLSAGGLGGTGALAVSGPMVWAGGTVGVDLHVLAGGALDIGGNGTDTLDGATLTNDGLVTWGGTGTLAFQHNSAVQNNGTFTDLADHSATFTGSAGEAAAFHNPGLYVKSAGSGVTDVGVVFDNTGTIEADAGTLRLSAGVSQYASFQLNAGTWDVGAGATLDIPTETISQSTAAIALTGPGATFTNLSRLNEIFPGGSLTVTGGATLAPTPSFLFFNEGEVTVGPGSTLTVSGLDLQSPGKLTLQIAGRPGGGQYGRLVDTSSSTVDGSLDVSLLPGADPQAGDVYPLVTSSAITGSPTEIDQDGAGSTPVFTVAVGATTVTATATQNVTDLAVTSVTPPAGSAAPGDPVTIGWTVKNTSAAATSVDAWTDDVYVSTSPTFDGTAVLVAQMPQSGALAGSGTYTGTFTGPLPGVVAGHYYVFVRADGGQVVPDADRANNVAGSASTFTVTDPSVLTLGAPAVNGSVAAGGDAWYRLDVPGGTTLRVTATFGAAGAGEVFVDYRKYPQAGSALGSATDPTTQSEIVGLAATQGGTYYVQVHGLTGGTFTLQADTPAIAITRLVNTSGSSVGSATLTVHGLGFTPNTTVSLVKGTTTRAATVLYVSGDTVYATFNPKKLPAGGYDVKVTTGAQTATAVGGYTVNTGPAGSLAYHLTPPASTPTGVDELLTIDVYNTGQTDVPTPLLLMEASSFNAYFRLPEDPAPQSPAAPPDDRVYFLPTSTDAPAGVVPAGYHGTLQVVVTRTFGTDPVTYSLEEVNANKPLPWNSISYDFDQPGLATDASNADFANFKAIAGGTSSSYVAALDSAATYLAAVGTPVRDAAVLIGYLEQRADAPLPETYLYQTTDASFPSPAGLPLEFDRGFPQSVSGRYRLGRFGRGWVDNWDIAVHYQTGDYQVFLDAGGQLREFDAPAYGGTVFRPTDGGDDVMTFDGTRFVLTGSNGSVTAFRADGQLDYLQDPTGNRVTASYDANARLAALTHSDGRALTFTWNAAGFIASVTDPAGRTTTYTYRGQELAAVTGPGGATQYTYLGGSGGKKYSLTSITGPDKVKVALTYDALGRLTSQTVGKTGKVTYTYGAGGGVTTTDAAGGTTTQLPNVYGQVAGVRGNTGPALNVTFDAAGQPARFETTAGQVWTLTHDSDGRVLTNTDPLGNTVTYGYQGDADDPTTVTDARGNTTTFTTDAAGHTTAVAHPAGEGPNQYVYDPAGVLVETVNGRGDAITYLTNADGEVTRRFFADGSHTDYTYDARGNLATATDASGTVTFTYQNDLLTKVLYPDGRFLQFTYDAAGRRTAGVDQDGFTTKYVYDTAGRLAELTDGTGAVLTKYTYDKAGRLVRKDDGNKTFTTYAYDVAGRLLKEVNSRTTTAVNSEFDYTYDAAGRVATMTTGGVTTTYGYDADGQLTSVTTPTDTTTYTYDAAGNRTSMTDNGVTTTYTVNDLNEVTAAGSTAYTYDLDGNRQTMTDGSGTTTYTWNDLNQLTGVTSPTDTISYTRDALGQLFQTTVDGQTTTNLNDPVGLGMVTAQYGAGGLIAHYVTGLGLEGRVDAAGSKAFYDFDRLGNVIGLTGSAGTYVNTYAYSAFGNTATGPNNSIANPFTFGGRFGVSADASGLLNMRARQYDPTTGGFIANDPLGLNGGDFNVRRFVRNDPVNATDPGGLLSGFTGFSGGFGASFTAGISFDFDSCSWYYTIGGGVTSGGVTTGSVGTGNVSQGTAIDAHGTLGNVFGGATGHASIQGDLYGNSGQSISGSADTGIEVGPSVGMDIIGYVYGGEIPGCWEEKLKKAKNRKPHPDVKFASPPAKMPGTHPVRQV